MSTAINIGASTLQLPDPGENYSLSLINQNNTNIANETNAGNTRFSTVKHVEYVRTAQNDNPSGTLWGNGNYSALIDTSNSQNYTDMVDYPANDQLRFLLPGIYTVVWKAVPNATTSMWFGIFDQAVAVCHGRIPLRSIPGSDSEFAIAANLQILPSFIGTNNAIISMKASISPAAQAVNWRLKVTKMR